MTRMRAVRLLLLVALVPLALLSLRRTQTVEACTGRGGTWDARTGKCDTRSFQSEPPFHVGRRDVVLGAVLVALGGAATAVLLRRLAVRGRRER
ncbi:MAG TPA: hypothetical protein VGC13_09870 [Longimicrobium sp.]|uniref:hypothetical protein n=1 Tax=Longimicrobium sp. TaxID=2029185 RepID=UPI002ED9EC93